MKITKIVIGLCLSLVLILTNGKAQVLSHPKPDTVDSKTEIIGSKSFLTLAVRYTSDFYYMGRADSAEAPYLTPAIAYYHKSGFFARATLSYLTAEDQDRVDLYTFSAGYDYNHKKFFTGISISEYFFDESSYAVAAEFNTYLNAYAGYDLSFIAVTGDASIGFSDDTDFFLGLELYRLFYTLDDRLRFYPSLYVNAGTQKYYDAYYTQRSTTTGVHKGKGAGPGNGSTTTSTVTLMESEKFQVLDYEASMEVSYTWHLLRFSILATWLFPVNAATVVADQSTYKEDLDNGFFWSAGVRLKIK